MRERTAEQIQADTVKRLNDGGPAFPQELVSGFQSQESSIQVKTEMIAGMSLRDYFAAAVLPAVYAASVARGDELQETIVDEAYELADRMLEARKP